MPEEEQPLEQAQPPSSPLRPVESKMCPRAEFDYVVGKKRARDPGISVLDTRERVKLKMAIFEDQRAPEEETSEEEASEEASEATATITAL